MEVEGENKGLDFWAIVLLEKADDPSVLEEDICQHFRVCHVYKGWKKIASTFSVGVNLLR